MNLRLFTKPFSRSRFNWNLKWIPQAVRALRAVKQNPILDKLKMSFTEGKKWISFIYLPTFSFFASSTLVVTFFSLVSFSIQRICLLLPRSYQKPIFYACELSADAERNPLLVFARYNKDYWFRNEMSFLHPYWILRPARCCAAALEQQKEL